MFRCTELTLLTYARCSCGSQRSTRLRPSQQSARPQTAQAAAGKLVDALKPRECSTSGRGTTDQQRDSSKTSHTLVSRRKVCLIAGVVILSSVKQTCSAAETPPAPSVGNCADCIGEINTTLNICTLSSTSCVSTQNDDEAHFIAPWQYDGSLEAALDQLKAIATGSSYAAGPSEAPFGISRTDAAAYVFGGVYSVITGTGLPDKPKRQTPAAAGGRAFDGIITDEHTAADGSQYLRISFGTSRGAEDASGVIDAEFLFLTGDSVVVLRAASRSALQAGAGKLSLSLSQGFLYDTNVARRKLEDLRKALTWESAPVITDFDPRFNNAKPLWFEKLYQPFLQQRKSNNQEPRYETPQGLSYDTHEPVDFDF